MLALAIAHATTDATAKTMSKRLRAAVMRILSNSTTAHDLFFPQSARTAGYKPGLAWFAAAGSVWVFVLVTLGALTTSIGAGMAFADWPLSNGSLNPSGWLGNLAMFASIPTG